MTTAKVVETSVNTTTNTHCPSLDYTNLDDQLLQTYCVFENDREVWFGMITKEFRWIVAFMYVFLYVGAYAKSTVQVYTVKHLHNKKYSMYIL